MLDLVSTLCDMVYLKTYLNYVHFNHAEVLQKTDFFLVLSPISEGKVDSNIHFSLYMEKLDLKLECLNHFVKKVNMKANKVET